MRPNSNDLNARLADLADGKVPQGVAVEPQLEDYENKKVVFSFEKYNHHQCELAKLAKAEAKMLIKELKKMNAVLVKNLRNQRVSGIACKGIPDCGAYSTLFNGLPPDVDLLEVDYTGAGRIFGYIVHNIFNIVAVNKKHR